MTLHDLMELVSIPHRLASSSSSSSSSSALLSADAAALGAMSAAETVAARVSFLHAQARRGLACVGRDEPEVPSGPADLLEGVLYPGVAGGGGGSRVGRHIRHRGADGRVAIRHPDTVRHPLTHRRGPAAATRTGHAAATSAAGYRAATGLTLAHPQLVLPLLFLLQVNLRVERLTGFRLLQHTHKPTVSTSPWQEASSAGHIAAALGGWARGE